MYSRSCMDDIRSLESAAEHYNSNTSKCPDEEEEIEKQEPWYIIKTDENEKIYREFSK